jgi:hypothetical protein
VLEWIAERAPDLAGDAEAEALIAQRWSEELASEVSSAAANVLEPPRGPVERWPRYGHIAGALRVDGAALARELSNLPAQRRLAEHQLTSSDGRIRGTADLVIVDGDGDALVIDHKMGAIGEDDTAPGGRYEQQLLLYVAMGRDTGFHASRAELRPLGRAPVPVSASDDRIADAVEEAHRQMDRYNNAVSAGRELDIATPSESSCAWCPYILDCPAVWTDDPPDLGEIRCVEGEVGNVQLLPASTAASIRTRDGDVVAAGMPHSDVHGRRPRPGDRLRVTGLRETSIGRLRGGRRTLLQVLD